MRVLSKLTMALAAALAAHSNVSLAASLDEPLCSLETSDPVALEICTLEHEWAQAFVASDMDFIERVVAPEFKLVLYDNGPVLFPRAPWMANTRSWNITDFDIKVADVIVTGETAIATLEGSWKVEANGTRIIDGSFFVSDVWVKRDNQWQVIRRMSERTEDRMPSPSS